MSPFVKTCTRASGSPSPSTVTAGPLTASPFRGLVMRGAAGGVRSIVAVVAGE
ncbi:MAG: hypothetical protein ACJLS2_04880 [Microcella pacifica]